VGRRFSGRFAGSRGQSLVEFALLAPLMVFLLFAILDLARIYTTMMSVESAAREAADFSTTFGAGHWSTADLDSTVAEMKKRACVAASNLPDYVGIDADSDGIDEDCSNPTFAYCVTPSDGGTCGPVVSTDLCDDPDREPPCTVTVTLHHEFHLFVPFHLDFFGVQFGLPVSIPFDRDSTFAMTDIVVGPSPTP
jgi:Flp pilus assembly protein TadG